MVRGLHSLTVKLERTLCRDQIDHFLDHGYVRQLEGLDVSGIEAMAHAAPVYDVMREDQSRSGDGTKSALANVQDSSAEQFRVTRVVES